MAVIAVVMIMGLSKCGVWGGGDLTTRWCGTESDLAAGHTSVGGRTVQHWVGRCRLFGLA